MAIGSVTFGQGRKNQNASEEIHREALSDRETLLRRYSEIAVGIGLLLLIASLLCWSAATADVFFTRGKIHLPDFLFPVLESHIEGRWYSMQDRWTPYGSVPLSIFILIITFGAIVRKRILLANIILGLSLLPWGLFSIQLSGLNALGYALIVYLLVGSVKNSRNLKSAIYVFAFLFQATIPGLPGFSSEPSKYLKPETVETVLKDASVFNSQNQPLSVQRAKNYLLAQVQLLNHNDQALLEITKSLSVHDFPKGSLEAERIAFMHDYLADQALSSHDQRNGSDGKLFILRAVAIVLGALAVIIIICGEGLEYLSNLILRRTERVNTLSNKINNATHSAIHAPTTEGRLNAMIRNMRFRFFAASSVSGALVLMAVICVLLVLWLAPASNGLAFTKVHILFQVANDLIQFGVNVENSYGIDLPFYSSSAFLWTYCIIVALTVFFLPEKQRYLRWAILFGSVVVLGSNFILFPVASVAALMFMGLRKYRLFGFALLVVSVSVYTYGHYEMLHSGKVEKTVSEIQAHLLQNYKRIMATNEMQNQKNQDLIAAYRYGLAQIAYLRNDIATAADHVHWIYQNSVPKSDLANQRLAIMRSWLIANGDDPNSPGANAFYVIVFGLLAGIAHWAMIASVAACAMAIVALIFAYIFFKRWKSMDSLATSYSSFTLEAKLLLR